MITTIEQWAVRYPSGGIEHHPDEDSARAELERWEQMTRERAPHGAEVVHRRVTEWEAAARAGEDGQP